MFSPNNLKLHPSGVVLALLWLPHLAALSLILSSSAPIWVALAASLAVIVNGLRNGRRHGTLRRPDSIVQVTLDHARSGLCVLGFSNGTRQSASILPATVVTATFVLLCVQPQDARRSRVIVITRWNCDPQDFRRLRVLLRFQQASPPDKAAIPE